MPPDAAADTRPATTANSGRRDYDQLVHFRQLAPGEPWFFIRGRDAIAGAAVRAYAACLHAAGGPPALVESALRQADEIDAWPDKKAADTDHMSAEECGQLEYELGRRAWDAREDQADPRVMLAEERAAAAICGRLRPALSQLLDRLEPQENGDLLFRAHRPGEGGRQVVDLRAIEALRAFVDTLGRALPDMDPAGRRALTRMICEAQFEAVDVPWLLSEMTFEEVAEAGLIANYERAADVVAGCYYDMRAGLEAACHALRAYQRGEVTVGLAETVADHLQRLLERTGGPAATGEVITPEGEG